MSGSTQNGAPGPVEFGRVGGYLAAIAVLWLALNEISLLSGGFLAADDSSWMFNTMAGPGSWGQADGWHAVLDADQLQHWGRLLAAYLVLDFVFIVVYTSALWQLARSWVRWLVVALAAFDVLENVGTIWLGIERCAGADCVPSAGPTVVAVITTLKWLAVIGLLMAGIARLRAGPLRRIWRAVWIQRFSLLAFLPLAALAIVPGSNVFDQLPDVQRRWLDAPIGLWHAAAAGLVYAVVLLPAIFVLGRIRADWAQRRVVGDGYWPFWDDLAHQRPRRQDLRLWALGPVLLFAVALVIAFAEGGTVFWPRLVVFCAIPVLVMIVSALVYRHGEHSPRPLRPVTATFPRDVMAAGDAIAIAALSLAGLGMVRAFTGLAALELAGLLDASYVVPPWLALLVGAALAIVPWLVARPVLAAIATWSGRPTPVRQYVGRLAEPGTDVNGSTAVLGAPRKALRISLLVTSIVLFLFLAAWPRLVADGLGVLAATMLALTTLVTMVGVIVVYAQERQPPEIFQIGPRVFRRRATPIIALLVVALILTGLAGGKTDIHPVTAAGTVPARPTMRQAFDAWLAQSGGCAYPVDAGLSIRPMLMVAAEGGGIRATYWTASALAKIGATGNGCGRRVALFSAGASGGALGVTIARFSGRPVPAVEAIAGHEALGAASVSLLSGDLLASAAGLRFDAASPYRTPTAQPLDRAELMETTWEHRLADLRTHFLPDQVDQATSGEGAVTGQLVLTSTAVRDGCNALLSQLDLSAGGRSSGGAPVCGAGAAGAHNYDLLGLYGRTGNRSAKECLGNIQALTAGLLASRFPYVTPSGVVEECGDLQAAQLVDGGYTDNTGLSTIVDLAPLWLPLVRAHNDQVIAEGKGEFVVPLVVYVENGTGPDFSTATHDNAPPDSRVIPGTPGDQAIGWTQIPESLVPPVTKLYTAKGNATASRPMLARAAEVVSPGGLCTDAPQCRQLRTDPRVAGRVFVVHQSTQPSLSAPLGWTLSKASQQDLTDDLRAALVPCGPGCAGFATLGDLIATLTPAGPN
ncbi:hypothetical protein FB561_3586 [Kribbella amoyensis]|uniref:Patatin-like phospholipase n=1 Tax=Kribbella amoyensis TaxID=996641 RepID=A0A561BUI5_9ACTN|nr:hypothetical protein [Kribbella amoyensis]TWD82453.1 hypothetical protein FB561_3586 [Kribbella amoyensis]